MIHFCAKCKYTVDARYINVPPGAYVVHRQCFYKPPTIERSVSHAPAVGPVQFVSGNEGQANVRSGRSSSGSRPTLCSSQNSPQQSPRSRVSLAFIRFITDTTTDMWRIWRAVGRGIRWLALRLSTAGMRTSSKNGEMSSTASRTEDVATQVRLFTITLPSRTPVAVMASVSSPEGHGSITPMAGIHTPSTVSSPAWPTTSFNTATARPSGRCKASTPSTPTDLR